MNLLIMPFKIASKEEKNGFLRLMDIEGKTAYFAATI